MAVRFAKTFGVLTAAVFAAGALFAPSVATAADFSGKKVTALVPFKEGGPSDILARLFAPYFSKYLPGNPTVIVRNMPGGATTRGNNWFEKNAKPDGLTWIGVSGSSQSTFVLGGKKVRYDMTKWKYVLAIPQGVVVYGRPEIGAKGKNVRDDVLALRKAQLVTGSKNPTSIELRLFLAYELLGVQNVKPVFGLSSGGRRKGILRGELNVSYDNASAYLKKIKKYVKKGTIVPLMTLGFTDQTGNIVRDPAFPELPTVVEAYKAVNGGKMPSGPLWKAYRNFYSMGVMTSKGFALPAGAPQEIVDTYIEAARKIAKDEKFLKIAKKRIGDYPFLYGKDAKRAFSDAVDVEPEVKAFMKAFIKKKFSVDI